MQWLQRRGYEAYLVGGCVRDLLLGLSPKDFDIATSALPTQVRRVFPRNCRIIGRRFKLAHLHFHGNTKILECSTFRRTPSEERTTDDLLIKQDNEFGTAEEDALRRDFTINALFFDPMRDRILDYTGGLEDLRARLIRTIGEPVVRFREDPVRILRAAKFAGRLGFHVDQPTLDAMAQTSPDLVRAAPPRVFEEILRLLRSGSALDSFQILRDIGATKVLLPVVGEFLAAEPEHERLVFWRLLEALDARVRRGTVPSSPVMLGALFARPVQLKCERETDRSPTAIAEEMLGPFTSMLRLPRRDSGCLKRICGVLGRFRSNSKRRFKPDVFLQDPYFQEALELFELYCHATGEDYEELDRWQDLAQGRRGSGPRPPAETHGDDDDEEVAALDDVREERGRRADHAAGDARETPPLDETGPEDGGPDVTDPQDAGEQDQAGDQDQADEEPRPEALRASSGNEPPARLLLPIPEEEFRKLSRSARRRRLRRLREQQRRMGLPVAGPGAQPAPGGTEPAPSAEGEARPEPDAAPGAPLELEAGEPGRGGEDGAPHAGDPRADQGGGREGRRRRRRRRGRRDRGGGSGSEQRGGPEAAPVPAGGEGSSEFPFVAEALAAGGGEQQGGEGPTQGSEQRPEQPQRQGRDDRGSRGRREQHGGRQGQEHRRDRSERRGQRADRRGNRKDRPRGKVEVLEPQPIDRSAFDVELDPTRAPTFGAVTEQQRRKSPIRKVLLEDDNEPYKPPPPPDLTPGGPPKGGDPGGQPGDSGTGGGGGGDTFGDW